MRDVSGDEIDGWDETIVPHDSRTPGVFDISDDEINGLLKQLAEKTQNITFILDSCHSGTATRGGVTARIVPDDERPPSAPAAFALGTRGTIESAGDFRLQGSNYVLISGSRSNELSNETQFGGQRHGAMTYFLAQSLKRAGEKTTYRDIMDEVKSEVSIRFPSQHPQLEGTGMDSFVFSIKQGLAQPYVLVDPKDPTGVTIKAGKVFGIRPGTTLNVFSPETKNFSEQPSATIKISRAEAFSSEGEITDGGVIKPHSRALVDKAQFHDFKLLVYFDNPTSSSILKKVKIDLAQHNNIQIVENETEAHLRISEQQGNLYLASGDLKKVSPPVAVQEPDAVQHLVQQVSDWARWYAVLNIQNPSPALSIGFTLRRTSDPATAQAPDAVPVGSHITYRVTNNSQQDVYITLLDLSSDGSISVLYPPPGAQEKLISGESFEREFEVFVPPDLDEVTDIFKVLATTKPINAQIFQQAQVRSAESYPPLPQDPLEQFLTVAMQGHLRGSRPVGLEGWVTKHRSLRIHQVVAREQSFAVHFDAPRQVRSLRESLGVSRKLCLEGETGEDCDLIKPMSNDGLTFEVIPASAKRSIDELQSLGRSFDEAYQIRDRTGALRAEPLLEVRMSNPDEAVGIDKRGFGGEGHLEEAKKDDKWHLKQIRIEKAWEKVREVTGNKKGQEAAGVLIAHIDTGYRHHPETWNEINGQRPIMVEAGYDYFDEDQDAFDPLLSSGILDNPGHGTASGSVIVSPPGCQLPGSDKCVNGTGRGARLVPLRVHRSVVHFNMKRLSRAILDVAENRINGKPQMMSIAMGGPPSWSLWQAVNTAEENGVLIIAAAGNYVRTVVWPSRFSSVISVAANNVHCEPWTHSGRGSSVDISAPGESVWRAALNENHEYINGMGKGTTFATGNTAGVAALWIARHQNNPIFSELKEQGLIIQTFRRILQETSWQPQSESSQNPLGTHCSEADSWSSSYGSGIIDAAAIMAADIQSPATRGVIEKRNIRELPLYSSLYPQETPWATIKGDYLRLFRLPVDGDLESAAFLEAEITYHYAMDESVMNAFDEIITGQVDDTEFERAREVLRQKDLSRRLRDALQ